MPHVCRGGVRQDFVLGFCFSTFFSLERSSKLCFQIQEEKNTLQFKDLSTRSDDRNEGGSEQTS